MATSPVIVFLQQLRRTALLREGAEQTDGQLLEAFIRRRDSQALEVLVRRHAPMVWGVCRRKLANHHDAEDAFQATFLVLVRKAASIRSRELLANWLYRVAHTTACKARQMAAKRSSRERQVSTMPEPQTEAQEHDCGPELRALLDEELSRLPEKFRLPIVLCDLEGRSRPAVAEQLCLPEGTVGSRLARGRALLARRLSRRGLSLSAASLAVVLPQQAASGSVPAAFLSNTIKTATLLLAGEAAAAGAISAQVSALAEGTLKSIALAKLKAAGVVLLLAALVLGGGIVTYHALADQPAKTERPSANLTEGNAAADIKQYGSEADAKRVAEKRVAAVAGAQFRVQIGRPEVRQQLVDLTWNEAAAKQNAPRLPEGCGCGSLKAELDREKGQWTVHGVYEIHGPDPKAFEVDWKLVVKYSPSTGRCELVDEGPRWFTANGEVPCPAQSGLHPVEYGLRPVVKKVAKGGGR
jgi:RNA polymerase sigma factor (sigma-70 family)